MVEDYGEWLKLKRESKGWTQQELAENSGVSQPQVSNIEKGKSLNPQQNTRRALESALGENAPQTVIDEAKIDGLGELLEFQPNESGTWPRCKGIYVLSP